MFVISCHDLASKTCAELHLAIVLRLQDYALGTIPPLWAKGDQ